MAVCSSVRAVMLFISFSEFCLGEVADCQAEYGQSACLPVSSSSLIQGHAASSKPQRAGSDEAPRLADLLQTFQEFVKPSSSSKSSDSTVVILNGVFGLIWVCIASAWVYNRNSTLAKSGISPNCGIFSVLCCLCCTPLVICFPIDNDQLLGQPVATGFFQKAGDGAPRERTNCC
eukprot:TRINITY_DN6923_c0_g1_i2.p1 TRINITY_DN6923_c0_g1~~TRINITY_DN6923_c0_g1_i2.p1  ORF type:complete len:175 (+),score=22.53 TRINITY_DN6923_c0_g1_i2:108-632(+)